MTCSNMQLCDLVELEALRLAHLSGLGKGLLPSTVACVYLACKNVRLYRTQYEFEVASQVPKRALSRAISRLLRTVPGPIPEGDCVSEMLPRIVSRFAAGYPRKVSTTKMEQYMLEIYRNRWREVHSDRSISINTVLAKCLLEAVRRVGEPIVTKETKGLIKVVCGVKSL